MKKRVWISRTKIVFHSEADFTEFLKKMRGSLPMSLMAQILEQGQVSQKLKMPLITGLSTVENTWVINDTEIEE